LTGKIIFVSKKSVGDMKSAIGWYVTHQGKAYGPVAFEDLKFEAKRGKLKPRLDYIWRQGLPSWVQAGEVDGLFEGQEVRPEEDQAIDDLVDHYFESREWGGMPRRWFLFCNVALPISIAASVLHYWNHIQENQRMQILIACSSCVAVILLFSAVLRLKNLAMSRMWTVALFLPLINFWVGYRLIACPPGYQESKEMDVFGSLLTWLYWFPIAALIGLAAFASVRGPEPIMRLMEVIIG